MLDLVTQSSSGTENIIRKSSIENEDGKINDCFSTKPTVTNCEVTSQMAKTQDVIKEQNLDNSFGKLINTHKRRSTESDPYPKDSFLRKYFAGKDKNLPKELQELFTPLKCNICHCSMSSTVTAKDHYEGKKHILNIRKWLVEHPQYKDGFFLPESIQQKIVDSGSLYCKYCDIAMSSEQQAQSHYIGKKHQTVISSRNASFNLKTWHCEWSLGNKIDNKLKIGNGLVNKERKRKNPATVQRFFCETCQVPCPSQITFNDHLAGIKHKKRMILLLDSEPSSVTKDNILEDVMRNRKKLTSPADLSIYRTPSGKYYCHSCNVTVNSAIQFLQHSESKKHKYKFSLSTNKIYK